jgi:hypothetical protein
VGLVAAQARIVVRRFRSRRGSVARRARLTRRLRRLVGAMAILTIVALRMRRVREGPLFVARRACLGRRWGRRMRVVTFVARDAGVLRDRDVRALRLGVALDARWSLARSERVTRQAIGLGLAARVRVVGLLPVAAAADSRAWVREPAGLLPVTIIASDRRFADVLRMASARAKLGPRLGHGSARHRLGSLRHLAEEGQKPARDQEEHRRGVSEEGFSPRTHHAPPWQSRHGRSRSLSRLLEKPRPCGLPPGPPTRWQFTQSCSPAPPWQPAHEPGSRRAWIPCCPPPREVVRKPGGCGLRLAVAGATFDDV